MKTLYLKFQNKKSRSITSQSELTSLYL
uniref:Uncharacterized protein n=1 Tax=Rhizophora mucronata TaxID=61149 RepID=A0A2P2J280_RHIMU